MKRQFVEKLKAGEAVDDVFVLAEKALYQKRDGNPYLNATFSDRSGSIKGVLWDRVEEIAPTVAAGDFVAVKGSVGEYKGSLQLVAKSIRPCPAESISPADFLPTGQRDPEKMFERLSQLTQSLETPWLKALVAAFWQDADFLRRFKTAPAAKNMHHAYIGGLLEHSLSMALLADKIAQHYSGVDRDLLLVGAIFHDIGKIREFDYQVAIDYSDEGRLLSHIVIGLEIVAAKIRQVPDFPVEQANLLKHMIVSHHGARELGSPEPPKTIEAVLLNYIDEMDSKINGIRDFINSDTSQATWTAYHRLLGRHFYTGRHPQAD